MQGRVFENSEGGGVKENFLFHFWTFHDVLSILKFQNFQKIFAREPKISPGEGVTRAGPPP